MKDSLENFIRQNREAFDDKEPTNNSWNLISSKLFGTNTSLWNSLFVWRAAAVVLLGLCVYLLIPKIANQRENTIALNEFADIETFYISQISEKVGLIEDQRGYDGLNGFTHDFQQLDAMYQVLKEEMKLQPSQKVKDALVLNLLVRIDLLNQQLKKIDDAGESLQQEEKKDVNV
jgi:hypothetical protein